LTDVEHERQSGKISDKVTLFHQHDFEFNLLIFFHKNLPLNTGPYLSPNGQTAQIAELLTNISLIKKLTKVPKTDLKKVLAANTV